MVENISLTNAKTSLCHISFLATKFTEGIHNEQQCRVAELKLAMV